MHAVVIETMFAGAEPTASRPFQNRDALLSSLEEHGIVYRRVDRPTLTAIVLCFAPLRGALVEEMPPEVRRRTVLVDEEGRSYASEAEGTRNSFGLLGLVEPGAWSNWKRGLFVAWGVFGRENIATRAGLSNFPGIGLQPAKERMALPDTLARFLRAAGADAEEANVGSKDANGGRT